MLCFVSIMLFSCGLVPNVVEKDPNALADTGEVNTDSAGTDTDDSDSGIDTPASDEELIRQAIAGEIPAHEAIETIARQDGFPILTESGRYLFACLCSPGSWSLTGDFNDWEDTELQVSGDIHWIEVSIPEPNNSRYKYHKGDDWIVDPGGRRYIFDENGPISLIRATQAHLEFWPGIAHPILPSRDLHVWVPQDGLFTHMLFAQDGQNLFDPSAMWGGWRLPESLPEDILVVGITNTDNRMGDYTHDIDIIQGEIIGGDGDHYADLMQNTIRPMMEAEYGTADVYGVMGSSLGGLISLYIAYLYENEYDMAISLSGTLGWGSFANQSPTIIDLYQNTGHRDTAIYIDSGGYGSCTDADGDGIEDDDPSEQDNYCTNQQMKNVLASIGYRFDIDLWHWHEPGAEHNEAAWAARVWRPLEHFSRIE